MKYNIEKTIKTYIKNNHQAYIFFWGHQPSKNGDITKTCLSQWWLADFEVDGIIYKSAEHYMMAKKALLFDDQEIFEKIIAESDPAVVKKLGRLVKNFDGQKWSELCYAFVVEGNFHKFYQNENLRTYLLSTNEATIVEASPYDKIWGIGLRAHEANPENWKGSNYLGYALMEARDKIKLEIVSEQIHNHWRSWAKEILEQEPSISNERKNRWTKECFVEYNQLSEEMKDLDRKYAKQIFEKLN